jgi:hypothetical protein
MPFVSRKKMVQLSSFFLTQLKSSSPSNVCTIIEYLNTCERICLLLKHTLAFCFGLLLVFALSFGTFGQIQPVHAQSISIVKYVKTEHETIPSAICAQIKKDIPGHSLDPKACVVTITHILVGPATLLSNIDSNSLTIKPSASCPSGGNTATAYDDLSYSFLWTEELYTRFIYHGSGCRPTLSRISGYVKFAIVGLTSLSQSTESYNSGSTNVTGVENIVSTNGLFGWGTQFSSCQSRSLDGNANWVYYSNLYAQDC